jgi:hypothetical protein
MSIKKLFDSHKANNALTSTSLEEEVVTNAPELESADNVREQIERINRFVPHVDFADPNNFVFYGSAKSYYADAISRIINKFPYDGSEEEITRFHNESNYLDLHIFDNEYPRTNGYIKFAVSDDPDASAVASTAFADGPVLAKDGWTDGASTVEYIKILGGPNTVEGGMTTGSFHSQFTGSNYYDTDIYTSDGTLALDRVGSRESNLRFNLSNGVTTEFWLNVNSDWPNGTAAPANQVIYDQWNGHASSSSDYGRLLIYLTGSGVEGGQNPIGVHLASGSNVWDMQFGGSTVLTGTLQDTWNHVALSFTTGSSQLEAKLYLNGSHIQTNTNTTITSFGEVTGSLIGYIGAGQTYVSGSPGATYAANPFSPLSASMDEFRYWKSTRTEKEIQQNYWTQIRGGTNEEVANAELGVYYKFNEGITGNTTTDATVLDYSGRVTNGTWTNYPGSSARSTDSAIVSAGAATSEYKDPIIYRSHSDVSTLITRLESTGSLYDHQNQSSLIDSMPGWIVEEDTDKSTEELKKLTQIIGSYFDSLQLQVQNISTLKDNTYMSSSFKPTPFAGRLLSGAGIEVPDVFVDATILERFAQRSGDEAYSMDLNEIKNLIYQNIYNNLSYLYKSKGTEKAFRNLVRCYGLGDDIVKFNAYGNNTTFALEDTYQATTTKKKYVDFNGPSRWGGVVYQNTSSINSETGNATYLSASITHGATTSEIEVIFPKQFARTNPSYYNTPFLTSSIFGWAQPATDPTNFTGLPTAANYLHLQAVRTDYNSRDAYFRLAGSGTVGGLFELTSDVYSNIYDNQKWNFAVRTKHKNWPNSTGSIDADDADSFEDIDLELYAVNVENGVVKNTFTLSTGSIKKQMQTVNKRFFIGAQRSDYTGSTINYYSDVRASSLRFYDTYLNDAVIRHHALDPANFGTEHPARNFYHHNTGLKMDNLYIPEITSLAFNVDFAQVTGSSAAGTFTVEDASSGSVSHLTRYGAAPVRKNTQQYAFQGYFPSAVSSTSIVSNEFLQASVQRLPEVVSTEDAVNVLSRDDELFPRDRAISQTFFAFEKSMFGIISQEMLNMFGTIVEFNNLIGEVVNKYRGEYKDLRVLRTLFFEKIQNNPDLDKFIDYYKWIDQSLIIFLQQFVPASANVSDEIRVMVEDHLLGRSKYNHKYPHLDSKGNQRFGGDDVKLEARVKSVRELGYNWEFGHAPIRQYHVDADQGTSSRWWKVRAERDNPAFETPTAIDSARQLISDIMLSFNSGSAEKFNDNSGAIYEGSTYATRQLSNTLRLTAEIVEDIGGGYNYPRGHKPDGIFAVIPKSAVSTENLRVAKLATPDAASEELRPTIKQHKRSVPGVYSDNITNAGDDIVGTKYLTPFIAYSSSVSPADGFGQNWQSALGGAGTSGPDAETGMEFSGYHNDSYGDDYEVPMQGPFTNQHVGGNRHRHTDLNEGSDTRATRPEAYGLYAPSSRTSFVAADSGLINGISTRPNYRRDETAKRPLNIKNIQHRTGSLGTLAMGNYSASYEVVSTTGRNVNNSYFIKNEGISTGSVTADTDAYVDGLIDFARPIRTRQTHVIVNRFSAPGSPESMGDAHGGPGLDYEAAEMSPYNNLNYRNTTVREPLQTLLTERSEQFGLRSGSAPSATDYTTNVTASYHKVHRNKLFRIYDYDYDDASTATSATGSTHDNYYVQHMIPRSDWQYAWITASTDHFSTDTMRGGSVIHGYFPYDGITRVSSSLYGYHYDSAINFDSASSTQLPNGTLPAIIDFAGLNINIFEPVSASEFTVGYPLNTPYSTYRNKLSNDAAVLPGLSTHRNGIYGYSTAKQTRVGQGSLGRHYRKNNLYTHTPDSSENITVHTKDGTKEIGKRYGSTMLVSQSVVTKRYPAIVVELMARAGETPTGNEVYTPVIFKTSFANTMVAFDNINFSNKIGTTFSVNDTAYNQIRKMYSKGNLKDPSGPIGGIKRLIYSEVVYPSLENAYTEKVRGRTGYTNDFWRDARSDRRVSDQVNAAGITISQASKWPLDGPESSYTEDVLPSGGIDPAITNERHTGELQNRYSHFLSPSSDGTLDNAVDIFDLASERKPAPLYARKHIFPFKNSVAIIGGAIGLADVEVETRTGDYTDYLQSASIGSGEAIWDAPNLAGRYEGTSSNFITKPVNPFYDSYDEYFANLKPKGQSYSIIPEFRITDHLDFFEKNSRDYLTEKLDLFRITGVPSGSNLPQNSDETDFYKVYSNSDFMKYFEIVREDHKSLFKPRSVTLKCRALKKFLPYNGFYPADRTLEIAAAFSSSYGDHISYTGADSGINARYNVFTKPLFAPGILFNTIKGGLAVDYPVMTGSYSASIAVGDTGSVAYAALTTSSYQIASNSRTYSINATTVGTNGSGHYGHGGRTHNEGWDKRIPFEALVNPERYMSNFNIVHDEPSPYCRIRATASYAGTRTDENYRNMMHNFLAESINFFLKKGRTTQIVSNPENQWKTMTPGQPYGMRVKIYRSRATTMQASGSWGNYPLPQHVFGDGKASFEMYSRASAFGPPVGSGELDWGTAGFSTDYKVVPGSVTGTYAWSPANGIYASHTPPYTDGESWVDIIYYPFVSTNPATSGSISPADPANQEARIITLDDIRKIADIKGPGEVHSNVAAENARYGSEGTYIVKWRFDQEGLRGSSYYDTQQGLYHGTASTNGPMSGVWANKWAMQGDASLNLFERGKGNRWKISTKYETPMLNFAYLADHTPSSPLITSSSIDTISSRARNSTIPRGMWHQFGRIPQDDEGVYLQITDIPETWLDNHPSATIMFDPAGQFDLKNAFNSLANGGTPDGVSDGHRAALTGYKFPVDYHGASEAGTPRSFLNSSLSPKPKSLVDICGFTTEPEKIGVLRPFKKIYEAIVAIPFIVEEGERKFLKTMAPDSAVYNSKAGPSLRRQARLMKKYVFPPVLDFVENPTVDAVAMYIFEFSHRLDKNDLSHIWQNLPPRVGRKTEDAMATVSHHMLTDELLGEPTARTPAEHSKFPKELQWMVFKVKQRAKRDYYQQIEKTSSTIYEGDASYISNLPFYTHNWPYDHFSLVELAEIEAEVTFGTKPKPRDRSKLSRWQIDNRQPSRPDSFFADDMADKYVDPEGPAGSSDAGLGDLLVSDWEPPEEEYVDMSPLGESAADVMGSLEGGTEEVKSAATAYADSTAGTDAAGSSLAGAHGGGVEYQTDTGNPDDVV